MPRPASSAGGTTATAAANGEPCRDFGAQGTVNLLADIRLQFKEGDEWRD